MDMVQKLVLLLLLTWTIKMTRSYIFMGSHSMCQHGRSAFCQIAKMLYLTQQRYWLLFGVALSMSCIFVPTKEIQYNLHLHICGVHCWTLIYSLISAIPLSSSSTKHNSFIFYANEWWLHLFSACFVIWLLIIITVTAP